MSELSVETTKRIVRVTLRQVGAEAGNSTPKIVRTSNPVVKIVQVVRRGIPGTAGDILPSITDTGGNVMIDTGADAFQAGDLSGEGNGSALNINDASSSISLSTSDGGGDYSASISAVASSNDGASVFSMGVADPTATLSIQMHTGENAITLNAFGGNIILSNLPAADPHVAGAIWNDSGVLKISAG